MPRSIQSWYTSTNPFTTVGCSVMRSSRPSKSPYVTDSPVQVELPRLWYSVGSLSQAGVLASSSPGGERRRVRERGRRVEGRERVRAGVGGGVEHRAGGIRVRARRLVDVGVLALGVVDHVGGVVRDDVEVDLDVLRVRLFDEGLELGVGAEVRVDLREVGDPVAVVAGARVRALALHGLVLEARRQPDRRRAEPVDVVELLAQPGDVAAGVEALVGRVVPGREAVARRARPRCSTRRRRRSGRS